MNHGRAIPGAASLSTAAAASAVQLRLVFSTRWCHLQEKSGAGLFLFEPQGPYFHLQEKKTT